MKHELILVCITLLATTGPGCSERQPFNPVEDWVQVDRGSFRMGSPATENCREVGKFKETPHQVTLTHAFEMQATETTQGQFENVMGYNPTRAYSCGTECPVDRVSWYDAAEFCNALSRSMEVGECYFCTRASGSLVCTEQTAYQGKDLYSCPGFRLPTEAEWEYACRAGTTSALNNGTELNSCNITDANANQVSWYLGNSGKTLHGVGGKGANAWGLKDMHGSVYEWVHDNFQFDLGSSPVTDPIGAASSSLGRVLRGGSVNVAPKFIRSGARYLYTLPNERFDTHGFRCVRTTK